MSAVEQLLSTGAARADARRNVARLVAAARAALDEQGLGVTTREIAHRAGVGLGTVHRRVPSVEKLIGAILIDTIDSLAGLVAEAAREPDPWLAFAGFAESYVQLRAASCGLHAALAGDGDLNLSGPLDRLREEVTALIQRTQDAGAIRADLDPHDVFFVLATAIPAERTMGLLARPDQWRRNLGVLLDGLRNAAVTTPSAQFTPVKPPA
ncbi:MULTISPECIES: TetR/AcrR family transcriptional regulator [unclassified Crossiella]|uniref:TetR/AcrR family transcriptional regulator n=1 Tax=unclassified Crossiella TaxID=2620835 RepID=UPI001FFFE037|nr:MULTISPECIES: TetR/AcrR family transcriptional regulator [unclassified Crossiella]MCK2242435.1 TetR/AcrR family transcriptional regulator [Crossiella sp. S99.2]MCK2254534.1 TetR/AcrR family transcriptional regulator [Crossiella sp. S99.1]